jgi:calcineurin-like phosphoesterase family protein
MKYFTSDWHLGHEKVIAFSDRPFRSVSEMDHTIIYNMTSVLKPGEEMFFLGDLAFRKESASHFFNSLPEDVDFHWIVGNHDYNTDAYQQYCKSISPLKEIRISKKQYIVMCHYPMIAWNRSHHGSWHLYGHFHRKMQRSHELQRRSTGKMLNVNLEFYNYKPLSEIELERLMDKLPDNWDSVEPGKIR